MAKFNATPHLILIAQAINADAKVENGKLTIEGRDRVSSWRSEPNGKFYLRVEGWGWRSRGDYSQPSKVLPIRKDGTMNYEEAASMLSMRFSHERHQDDKRSVAEQNKALADSLREEIGYGLGYISADDMRVGRVKVDLGTKVLTPDQVRAIKAPRSNTYSRFKNGLPTSRDIGGAMDSCVKSMILKVAAATLVERGHPAVVMDGKIVTNAPPVLVGVAWTWACITFGKDMDDFLIDDAIDLALENYPKVV